MTSEGGPVILVIDPDEPTRHALSRVLSHLYVVTTVPTPDDALLAMRESLPDLILADVNPFDPSDRNGAALAIKISNDLGGFAPKIVLMTADPWLARGLRLDGFRVLGKPATVEELWNGLRAELETK